MPAAEAPWQAPRWQALTQLLLDSYARWLKTDLIPRDGYVDDYRGIRISSTGERFEIQQAIVWNLIDAAGQYQGQAATFHHWNFL